MAADKTGEDKATAARVRASAYHAALARLREAHRTEFRRYHNEEKVARGL